MRDLGPTPAAPYLSDRINALVAERATGLLLVHCDGAERRIAFEHGELRSVSSSVEDEMLGTWLVRRKRITEGQCALALLQQGAGAEAPVLGQILIDRQLLSREDVDRELRELAMTIVGRAAAAPDWQATFHDDRQSDFPSLLPQLSAAQASLVAARSIVDIELMRERLGDPAHSAWTTPELNALLGELVLSPTEAFILSRINGTSTLGNLIRSSSLAKEPTVSTLYALTVAGILRIGPAPQAAPAQPSSADGPAARRTAVAVNEDTLDEVQRTERQRIRHLADQCPRMDHYRALGLSRDASHDQVVRAWESIADRYSAERLRMGHLRDLAREFDIIVERAREAYGVLSNPKTRRRYDPILESVERDHAGLSRRRPRGGTDAGARREIVEANFKRASALVREGEIYLAIQLLEEACSLEPRPSELLNLARLLLRNPLWTNRALDHIRRATEIDPGLIDGWIELAEFWRRRNNADMQRKSLEKALSLDPEHERAATMYRQLTGKRELDRFRRRLRLRQG